MPAAPSPLHCPHPQPLAEELQPLLEFLQEQKPVEERTTFPRGTLQPDGRLDIGR